MRIDIIGAGPIGGQTAYLLAKKGFDTHLHEDHATIGKPIQCTGLMTVSLNHLIQPKKEFLVNETEHIELIAPDNSKLTLKAKEYIVDRHLFDTHFVNKATNAGATLHTHQRFTGIENSQLIFKDTKNNTIKRIKKNILIGADGANSIVAKLLNPEKKRAYCVGIQARVRGTFDPEKYTVYFNNAISPGFFAWIVPESHTIARVGLKGTNTNFETFLSKHKFKRIEMQAGPIPIYNPKYTTERDNTYIVGDAATHVKATTAGGLIPGLKAAQCLADAIENHDCYEKRWRKAIGRDLWLHLKLRTILNKFTDDDWNKLIHLLSQKHVRPILEKHDREHPWKLLKAVVKEPRLVQFAKYLI
jgi:geranylgeranyl reductase family protein